MKDNYRVVEIVDSETKSLYTRAVLEKLPEWFGNKQALDDYVEKVRYLPFWTALDDSDECVGFFAVKIHYQHTGEIVVCGVHPEHHHNGAGTALYKTTEDFFLQNGCKYIVVKTLSDAIDYEPYARTRKFYTSLGFESLITLTEMWDGENPCLIMLKSLAQPQERRITAQNAL